MKPIFDLPELLNFNGLPFTSIIEGIDPNSCTDGCSDGCDSGCTKGTKSKDPK